MKKTTQLFLIYLIQCLCLTAIAQNSAQLIYEKGLHTQKTAQSTPNGKRLHKKAIKLFNKAIKIKSEFPEAYFGKGVSYAELGEDSIAITLFDKAIEMKPDYAMAFQHRGMRKAEDRIHDYRGAIKDFDNVIKLNAGSAYTYYFRGYSKYKLGMLKEACEDFKKSDSLGGVGYDWLRYCK